MATREFLDTWVFSEYPVSETDEYLSYLVKFGTIKFKSFIHLTSRKMQLKFLQHIIRKKGLAKFATHRTD